MPFGSLVLAAFLLAAAPASKHHADDKTADARARMAAYLADHDVPTPAELRALDGNPGKALIAVAQDEKAPGLVRARAVAALRGFGGPEVYAFLAKLIDDKATTTDATLRLLLRRAAITLGWLSAPDSDHTLAGLFANADPEVRVDAAIGIGFTRKADAAALLRQQWVAETVPRVREQIERQLRVLGVTESPDAQKAPPKPERPPMRGGF